MTLSHRWGVVNEPPKLSKGNFKERQVGIVVSSVPKSFRDAIQIARRLGVGWLWIDSLCIIQDSEGGWREPIPQPPLPGFLWIYRVEFWSHWPRKIEDAELNQRGWVVQERDLAARKLHFTRTEVFWECIVMLASESVPDSPSKTAEPGYALIKPALMAVRRAPRKSRWTDGFDADHYTEDETGQVRSPLLRLRGRLFPESGEGHRGLPKDDFAHGIDGLRFVHTSLHIDEGDIAEAENLWNCGSSPSPLITAGDAEGETPLHWAAMTGNSDIFRSYLSHYADQNAALSSQNLQGKCL
ncbi:hypothetical protein DL762_008975 [Monosporascus cannonballus]|uniref:Heterokaryon incompatibility domain-containing protein n=1 Tax=Monosporascus cannonballus TaxID=155416 RepID=A0ABY0GUM8_9PEZI|nr:hypothetical protein DL762_008975 [Monosporascus cannonballus]